MSISASWLVLAILVLRLVLKKDKSGEIPKYLVFFKARDADALTAAFKEYTAKTDRKKEKPSILRKLRRFKDMSATLDTPKVRKKELDAR